MRSAKETGCFPYTRKNVYLSEVFGNGNHVQLYNETERLDAYFLEKKGETKICAVWPDQWLSNLFIIDNLEEFDDEQHLFDNYIKRRAYS